MPFADITKAQLSSEYSVITDTSASLQSIAQTGDATLKVTADTINYLVSNLSQAEAKPVLLSTGSNYYKLGDYADGKVSAELVRIVEPTTSEGK
ncbi:hypothetical protein [Leclercia sp.]|uniref:hypothetical protein n=1 Tax=Leclercia sp. TaxID=1898428 RepID=UPI0028A9F3CE|nr:hypothetical protein [Leclercia sp.]